MRGPLRPRLIVGDEFARPSAGFGEPFRPAGKAEYRHGRPEQRAEQPGPSSPTGHLRPVRRERRSLSRRVPPNVDPVRNRRSRRAVRAHLFEAVAGQQAKEEEQPGGPGDQFTWHRRLHDPHSRESGRPRADLVHPHVVTMAVAALRV